MCSSRPTVLVLDGDYDNTLSIATELTKDLGATVVGTGTTRHSRLLRSRYCDVGRVVPPPDEPGYGEALLSVIETERPDVVLPIGYDSMATIQEIRSAIPDGVSLCVPSAEAFNAAANKTTTLERGDQLGIETPAEYSDTVADLAADGRPDVSDALPFPVFCKAQRENGHATTAPVTNPATFWDVYDRIANAAPDGEVLVQEYIDNDGVTYGCGQLWLDDELTLGMTHEEHRSVPRHGGSGTYLRLGVSERLEAQATRLLNDLDWNGIALVEFKQRADGSFVLMEINPKFWASYALASQYGYRFASTIVARVLDLDVDVPIRNGEPMTTGELLFPLRELQFWLTNRRETSLGEILSTVLTSSAGWDIDRSDLGAWLTPPATLLQQLPTVETWTDGGREETAIDRSGSNSATAESDGIGGESSTQRSGTDGMAGATSTPAPPEED